MGVASPHDELLFDCEIADCGMMPRTFWASASLDDDPSPSGASSRGLPRRCSDAARPPGFRYDPRTSGAEWWVQIRSSPPRTGRYSMFSTARDDGGGGGGSDGTADDSGGMPFHWDKDEKPWKMCGGVGVLPSARFHRHLPHGSWTSGRRPWAC